MLAVLYNLHAQTQAVLHCLNKCLVLLFAAIPLVERLLAQVDVELAGRDARQTLAIIFVDGLPQIRDIASTWDCDGVRIIS